MKRKEVDNMIQKNTGILYTYRSNEYMEMRQEQVKKLKKSSPEELAKRKADLRKKLGKVK
jgi:hypothetical protein